MQTAIEPSVIDADDTLVVLDKPAGLLSVPGRGPDGSDHLLGRAQARWPDVAVVHRLDMATSGLIVLARGAEAQRRLSRAFAERAVDKTYVAVVQGLLAADEGCIDLPLAADWPNRPRQQVDHRHGKPSLTHWRVIERDLPRGLTRLALTPVTGRTHQLRVHLLAIGHPIVGDALYAPEAALHAAPVAKAALGLGGPPSRLLLHASTLALPHPSDGSRRIWQSPAPF